MFLSTTSIASLVGTTTTNYYNYGLAIFPYLLVFGVITGFVFLAFRWIWSAIRGHGIRS